MDEKGPVAAKLYPPRGQRLDARHRPHYHPDYSRRGYIWLFGALVPHTGEGLLYYGDLRESRNFCAFMGQVARWVPQGDVHVVIDSLSIHTSVESLLWNFGHSRSIFRFLPKGAAWLNLIEGWWNILGHGAKVVAAVGLPLVKQSPASPELDPAERVFETLRREVEGEVSGIIENKMAVVAGELEAMTASPEGVQRLTGWSWTRDTLARLPQDLWPCHSELVCVG